ncbi:hypothetical protein N7456_012355 [Penicillium angulare]|uniref:FAD-binding domain-containing protein n=1 Tax=Penicillium angulare TaxID=116970 RepID=A0A9W9K0K9_9EURO|nr:hypothetical protein N7456_012355 [Penicillium angulare]
MSPHSNPETTAHPPPFQSFCEKLPERFPSTGISVLIAGGGVAGLLAALECWRKGHNVRIVERSPSRLLSGDGFTIGPSALLALDKWPEMSKENERISYESWMSWHKITGEMIKHPAPFQLNPSKAHGSDTKTPTVYRHSRPKMHQMLSDQLDRVGLAVEYGKRVLDYYEDSSSGKAGILLDGGEKLEADVVVAADGVGSKSSRIVLGQEVRARPTGFSIYRAAYPLDETRTYPILDENFPLMEKNTASSQLWMGDGVHSVFGRTTNEMSWYLTYPVNQNNPTRFCGRIYINISLKDHGNGAESWSNLVDPDTVLQTTATIKGWPDFANRLIKETPKDRIHDYKLMWREPQPCWASPSGRVIQIGDAAHTFFPSSGNGATQGMEDAVSLAACLQLGGKDNVHWATRVHNKLRVERVHCLQLLGVLNHEMRGVSADAQPSQAKPVGLLGSWIWNHNPEQYAIDNYENALACLTDARPFSNTNTPPGYVYQSWTIDSILEARKMGKEFVLEGDWE